MLHFVAQLEVKWKASGHHGVKKYAVVVESSFVERADKSFAMRENDSESRPDCSLLLAFSFKMLKTLPVGSS